ncbi:flagellar basal body P-ring protein FlgI [Variovorax sp. CAN2819]|uniref:flagellar basal body P-ring protein FlgI n=1 Tax=Variovorax sp. CAN15 TaxID=3046727 RepID=UPI00264858D0|nr:flagellar basal body P-ring protein FlgI [Variovorax sp. CAN15]MDN6886198.1 flagellar basal body P-ring protein FlgI [Variovorax sp. CAN15]
MHAADAIRVKDLGKLKGWRDNALFGTGIVTGLAGTGDSPANRATRQSLANVLSQFNLTIAPEAVQSRNVAVVMVSASLPTFAREGDTLDVTVSSAGDARSLVGGTLLITPLKGANGRVYALAQGGLSVGGYRYDANGNVVQKNHPTSGSIPNGATVEVGVNAAMLDEKQSVTFVLSEPDYTTASRVAAAINSQLGSGLARAKDASGIEIAVPESQRGELVSLFTRIENVTVEPDRRAKVVINERTGTVVSGGDVRISKVAISHGDIKIAISSQNTASQPINIWNGGPDIRTAIVTNTRVDVDEQNGAGFVTGSNTVSDLVQSLARLKTSTRDVISILRAVKAAGALHGELVVQ